jgi:hypothetical protein
VAAKHGRLRRGYCIRLWDDTPHFGASRTRHPVCRTCIDGLGTGARKRNGRGMEEVSIAITARRMLELRTHEERTHVPYVTALEGRPAFCLCRNSRIKRCIKPHTHHHHTVLSSSNSPTHTLHVVHERHTVSAPHHLCAPAASPVLAHSLC